VAAKPTKRANPVKLAQAAARVADLESKLAAIDAALADPSRFAEATALTRDRAALASQLEAAEAEFLALYEA
jgi:ATP-binding cassette subfamily F protein 3